MENERFLYKELSYALVGAAIDVHKELGCGFLEKVYENALCVRLTELKIPFQRQAQMQITYHRTEIGHYVADIIVDEKIIIELKTVRKFELVHEAQILNYLKASGLRVGYLLNFANTTLGHRRLIL